MKKKEKVFFENLIKKYSKKKLSYKFRYSLLEDAFSLDDILSGIEVLLSGQITMSEITEKFQYEFAKYVGAKYALMVNSGSSANLLAAFALVNPRKKNFLKKNDECLIPALCWSTSLWPIIQSGLKPKFVDVDIDSFAISDRSLEQNISKNTKALMMVHVLGNASNIQKISQLTKKRELYLIEDTCESLGSQYDGKFFGTFGDFGTYSFYYSHQITSGEGGMIVCNNLEDYQLIYSMRSHGWDRRLKKNFEKRPDTSFNFINSGFNLRPLDITASIGLSQFKRLNSMIKIRSDNRDKIIKKLINSPFWQDQFTFFYPTKKVKPSWFGFPVLINKKYLSKKKKFINLLNQRGIETRMIISGNLMNHASIELYGLNPNKKTFNNAQEIEDRGFFIGLHTESISEKTLNYLEKNLLTIDKL
jgi:CDP-6-deoxy-D-xylo-4-hexulose-3-dehydrase